MTKKLIVCINYVNFQSKFVRLCIGTASVSEPSVQTEDSMLKKKTYSALKMNRLFI
jgi:hypothetical protein